MPPRKRARVPVEVKTVDREAPDFDLLSVIGEMPVGDAACREDRHGWEPFVADRVQFGAVVVRHRIRRCPRCKSTIETWVHPVSGEYMRTPKYDYRVAKGSTPGYLIKGLGAFHGAERGALRLANMDREEAVLAAKSNRRG